MNEQRIARELVKLAKELEATQFSDFQKQVNRLRSTVNDMRETLRQFGMEHEADAFWLKGRELSNDAGKLLRRMR